MLADGFAQGLRAVIVIYIIDPAEEFLLFRGSDFLNDGITDDGSQHNPMGPGIQGNEDDTIGVAVHIASVSAVPLSGGFGIVRTGVTNPMVNAKKEIMVLAFRDRGKFIPGNDLNMLGFPVIGKLFICPLLR